MSRKNYSKMTTEEKNEEFIRKANIVHNFKYDYSKVVYVNCDIKIIIICPIHGEFLQSPTDHLSGKGCILCGIKKRTLSKKINTKNNFIKNFNNMYNFKYDYSKVIYVGRHVPIIIVCPIHGEFLQTPTNHLKGKGCKKCKNDLLNKEKLKNFIDNSNIVHNFKYDYSYVNYIDSMTNVLIYCKEHDLFFEQSPVNHIKGQIGCKKCLDWVTNTKDFIDKSGPLHNFKYDYSKVDFKRCNINVIIICPIHGEFLQTPISHLRGCGCGKCAGNIQSDTEDFINKSNIKYNFKYDYSKVNYINAKIKVIIICPIHGEFLQTPDGHLSGRGCLKCNSSKGEIIIDRYLNDCSIKYETQHKFPDCKYKSQLSFDFYLSEYNTCIEFDGIQHFVPIKYSKDPQKNLKKFEEVKIRDFIKNQYCLDHNIRLIRIPYTDIDMIDEILEKELK